MDEARRPTGASTQQQHAGRRPVAEPINSDGAGQDSRSLSEMVSSVIENLQNIVRYEVQLAKTEMQEEAKTAGKGAAMMAAAAVVGIYAVGLFLLTAVWALATQIDRWLAALIVAVVVTAVAGILAMIGKKRLDEFSPKPEQTIDSVKEDIEWVKQQTP